MKLKQESIPFLSLFLSYFCLKPIKCSLDPDRGYLLTIDKANAVKLNAVSFYRFVLHIRADILDIFLLQS